MTENMIGVVFLTGFALILGFIWLASWWHRQRMDRLLPWTWSNVGAAPAGVDKALAIIKAQMPSWSGRWGGEITWVKEPFNVMTGINTQTLAAGTVDDFYYPKIRLLYFEDVSQTALAHEIFHVWQDRYEDNKIVDGDPRLYAWVNETNAKIRAGLV